jgi:PAS domain S-box-containing protein
MENLHRLLKRQVDKFLPDACKNESGFSEFLEAINQAYLDFDANYEQVERTLEISSNELFKNNRLLEQKVKDRTSELLEVQQFAGMGSFEIDFSAKFSAFTEHAYNLLGLSAEETKFSNHLLSNLRKNVHPDDLESIDTVYNKSLIDKKDVRTEFRVIHPEGRIVYLNWNVKNVFSEDGRLHKVSGTLQDMTERVKAQVALLESENRFRSLVQNSSDITTILSATGEIVYESPSFFRLFGYEAEEIMGSSVFGLIHPDDLERVLEEFQKLIQTGEKNPAITFRFKNKEGGWIYLEAIGSNMLNEASVSGIVINSRDVTERVETEIQLRDYAQSLEKINKELDQFAYIVSHDLKAPLRAINNLSVWIEEDLEGKMEEDTKKNFGMLRGRIHRLETLINGILQYSRAGRIKAETDEIELNPFIDDLINNLSPPENFQFIIQENLPVLNMEKIALDQVFTNFLSNTIKYNSNPTPVVKVLCEERPLQYEFCVEDNGPGIDKEFHEKVFQIFQTLQARDKFESTGVGLAIVKKIIEEKGGKAWVESELGNGSKFFFTIPKTEKAIN